MCAEPEQYWVIFKCTNLDFLQRLFKENLHFTVSCRERIEGVKGLDNVFCGGVLTPTAEFPHTCRLQNINNNPPLTQRRIYVTGAGCLLTWASCFLSLTFISRAAHATAESRSTKLTHAEEPSTEDVTFPLLLPRLWSLAVLHGKVCFRVSVIN